MKLIQKNKEKIFVLLLLLVAAFLRLYRIEDYMTFLGDEGRDVLVVYNILHGHFTLLGPTASVGGFFLGPIYYYFMAPFLFLFNYNPVGPAVMIALFGIATVWLIYKIGKELFGPITAIIASILYAFSPVVLTYSRASWNPNPLPFFTLLLFYLLYKTVSNKSMKIFFICGILLGIILQLHYLGLFVGLIAGTYVFAIDFILWQERKEKLKVVIVNLLKKYALLFSGFILGWLPFLLFELKHGFLNIKSIINFVFHSGETGGNSKYFEIVTNVFFRIFERLLVIYPQTQHVSLSLNSYSDVIYFVLLIIAIASSLLVLIQFIHRFKTKSKKVFSSALFFLWLFIGVILFGFYKKPIYDYYFEFMFPLPFLLIGNLFELVFKKNVLGRVLVILIMIWLLVINIKALPFWYGANRQLYQAETIAKFINDKTDGKPFNFALITSGNSDHAYRYFFTLWHHQPVTIDNAQIDPKRTTVTDQLFVVCESIPCHPLGYPLWEVAGFGRAEIVGEWDVIVVKVYKLVHYKAKSS